MKRGKLTRLLNSNDEYLCKRGSARNGMSGRSDTKRKRNGTISTSNEKNVNNFAAVKQYKKIRKVTKNLNLLELVTNLV